MGAGNRLVALVLRSPAHRVLSGSTDLVRYVGRRSGRTITTPTQYARHGDHVVILVGRADTKSWWHNFHTDWPLELLLERRWLPMTGVVVVGRDDPEAIAPLLDSYLTRHPAARRSLVGATPDEQRRAAVVVDCRPR